LHHKEDTTTSIKEHQSHTTTTTIKAKVTIKVVKEFTKTTIIMLHTVGKIKIKEEDITNIITPKAKTWVINKRKVITTLTKDNHSTNKETHSTNGKHHKAIQ
tara:strand:+ start:907 stop:1212 length:306 start_codon:yes stop_codon:yes gene_type:complete